MTETDTDLDFAPWDGRRVPVTLLGGYLGAGKTTAINAMLSRTSRPIAVLVNDVGPINIDASLVKARHGDTIELTDGCICCSLAEGLAAAFETITARPDPPDHVVIELSGIADPRRLVAWANSPGFRHDSTIVLIDADQVIELMADEITRPYLLAQISCADLLVYTKLDLADQERLDEVRALMADLAGGVLAIDSRSMDDIGALLDLASRQPRSAVDVPDTQLFDPHVVTTFPLPRWATDEQLLECLDELGPEVIRAKGISESADGGKRLVQVVGRRRTITPLPAAEDESPTDLVVISLQR